MAKADFNIVLHRKSVFKKALIFCGLLSLSLAGSFFYRPWIYRNQYYSTLKNKRSIPSPWMQNNPNSFAIYLAYLSVLLASSILFLRFFMFLTLHGRGMRFSWWCLLSVCTTYSSIRQRKMNNTKVNWILLVLFCVLTVVFCILLLMIPASDDKIIMLGRIGYWLGLIACAVNVVVQVFEIRRKKRDNKQKASLESVRG